MEDLNVIHKAGQNVNGSMHFVVTFPIVAIKFKVGKIVTKTHVLANIIAKKSNASIEKIVIYPDHNWAGNYASGKVYDSKDYNSLEIIEHNDNWMLRINDEHIVNIPRQSDVLVEGFNECKVFELSDVIMCNRLTGKHDIFSLI